MALLSQIYYNTSQGIKLDEIYMMDQEISNVLSGNHYFWFPGLAIAVFALPEFFQVLLVVPVDF